MKKNIIIIAIFACMFWVAEGVAQQFPVYGQYVFNSSIINPAQAGSSQCNYLGLLGRHQWIGVDGAPRTYSAYVNLSFPSNLGIAGIISQENIGRIKDLSLQGDIAYHTRLSKYWRLGVGIRATAAYTYVDLIDFNFSSATDPWYGRDFGRQVFFNTGVGVLLHSSRAYLGFSAPRLLRNKFSDSSFVAELATELHLFTYGGTNISITELIEITPSFLLKYAHKAPFQADLNCVFAYNNLLDFGVMVRTSFSRRLDSAGLLFGITIDSSWQFGYKYEYPMNAINHISRQTHEVALRYRWCVGRRHWSASPKYFL